MEEKKIKEIDIVDNYMEPREFRNYVNTMFYKKHYDYLKIDDVRVCDGDKINDNDQIVTKDGVRYTAQSFLNTKIKEKHIKETLKDMEKENVNHGLIITNFYTDMEMKDLALEHNITILDRAEFEDGIYDKYI
jgi:hypothetical protein